MRTPTAALFDLDGTLINSEPRSLATWARFLDSHGIAYDDETLRGFMGRRGGDLFLERPELFAGLTLEQVGAELRAISGDPDLPPVERLPESIDFLRGLHGRGVPFALVTSARREWAELALDQIGVLDLFHGLVTADDVSVGKPDPQCYLLGAGVVDEEPGQIVVFEDTPAGIRAAKRAGMACVGVTTTHQPEWLRDADRVVAYLTEVEWPHVNGEPAHQEPYHRDTGGVVVQRRIRVESEAGLHARPASLFVQAAAHATGEVTLAKNSGDPVSGKSILTVLSLDVRRGDEIIITVEGDGAERVLERLVEIATIGH